MPIVPSLKLAHLAFGFFTIPAVMLLKLCGQDFHAPTFDLTDLLFGQASPSLLYTSLDLNEAVLPPVHVNHLRCDLCSYNV